MSEFVHGLGVSHGWAYTDVWGLDSDMLSMIPQPVLAVLLLFPITENYEKFREEEETHLKRHEQLISPKVVFFRQTIPNACGTIGLLHSLATHDDIVEDGPLKRLIEKAKPLSPDERAELLEQDTGLAHAHHQSALDGQTHPPNEDEDVNLHFICFIQVDAHLYELDGRKPFPINHGKSTNLLEDSAKVIHQFMKRDPENLQFTVVALAPNQDA
jgi:ubiquitin carboxyl-terminal hydrolase L3